MDVHDLGLAIHATEYASSAASRRSVSHVYASDTMSDLIAHAAPDTLLVTPLNNSQLARVADLMDVPGICLVAGATPSADLVARAVETGTTILVSPHSLADTLNALRHGLGLPEGAATA
jgi:hypothetical protein